MNPADYFFYRVLQWRQTCKPVDRMPILTTKMTLGIVALFNLLTILPWIDTNVEPFRQVPIPALGLILGLAILGVVHLIWITSGRYLTLSERFAEETPSQRRHRTWMIFAYLGLTICALIVSPIVAGASHGH